LHSHIITLSLCFCLSVSFFSFLFFFSFFFSPANYLSLYLSYFLSLILSLSLTHKHIHTLSSSRSLSLSLSLSLFTSIGSTFGIKSIKKRYFRQGGELRYYEDEDIRPSKLKDTLDLKQAKVLLENSTFLSLSLHNGRNMRLEAQAGQ
jgi:ABC-type transport system involved in multi-copper enzyme maturation permease subunit